MKAYGYVRVSGKSQIDGYGFDRQEETIRAYAEKAGYEVVRIFREEAVSGTLDESERPAFQEMMAEILRDGVRTVIIEGLDRLAREYRIQETLLIYLASKGVNLLSARTEENITDALQADPMRKALIQIQGIFAELEKNLLVKKLKQAREKAKAETGKCEGRKGYREKVFKVGDAQRTFHDLLAEIRRLRRKPKGSGRRLTYIQVAEELNRQGWRTAAGKVFTGQIVQNILR